jgi:hypothetical protein
MMNMRRMRWARHVAHMGKKGFVSVGMAEGKGPQRRLGRGQDNMEMALRKVSRKQCGPVAGRVS